MLFYPGCAPRNQGSAQALGSEVLPGGSLAGLVDNGSIVGPQSWGLEAAGGVWEARVAEVAAASLLFVLAGPKARPEQARTAS